MKMLSEAEAWRLMARDLEATPFGEPFDTSAGARGIPVALWRAMAYRVLERRDQPPMWPPQTAPLVFPTVDAHNATILFILFLALEAEDEAQ